MDNEIKRERSTTLQKQFSLLEADVDEIKKKISRRKADPLLQQMKDELARLRQEVDELKLAKRRLS